VHRKINKVKKFVHRSVHRQDTERERARAKEREEEKRGVG
jgi:hypothetical protein